MRLETLLLDMIRRTAEVERRLDGMVKQGPVAEVDPAAGTVRIRLNEANAPKPFLSPPIPYTQLAGALKVHSPPSVGQQMTIISGAGDFRQGLAVPMTWSNQNAAPSDKGDEHVLTFGDVRFDLKGDGLTLTVGGFSLSINGDGLTVTGGEIRHDEKNIGSTHKHEDVAPGPALTGAPVE